MAEKEYIDLYECRDDFYATVLDILSEDSTNDRANQIIDAFDYLPTADVEPVKHGHWKRELMSPKIGLYGYICSNCNKIIYVGKERYMTYCGNCGAKMDGGD